MTTRHTPGPWTTDEAEHDSPHQSIRIGSVMHHTVCTVWIDDAPVHEFNAKQQANARLIAAAPELLKALIEIANDYADRFDLDDPSTNPGIKSSIKEAHAAIAKATGAA